ncbi:MAG TPA: ferrochelatase, partial [Thermodesulfovibrionales bacterium]|nr:ferrochelatase [Thermodesulfovibrionales bacterium]
RKFRNRNRDLGETGKEIIGVMLLNLGGPDSLRAVRPFLYNLFSDRKIIRLGPPFLQKPIAWLISSLRSRKTEKLYRLIGGKSPIFDLTMAQARALEEALNRNSEIRSQKPEVSSQGAPPPIPPPRGGRVKEGVKFKTFVGMRYWHPFIEEVVPKISRDGVRKLIALNMYPHYSHATAGSSLSRLQEVLSEYPIEVFCISSWYDHPLYIEALIDVIKKGLDSFNHSASVHLLFSAHNLPESLIKGGDPYVNQIKGTIREVTKSLNIEWYLSYQSKSGPVKWLKPSTGEMLKRFAELGYKNILVVPISFVSDHIETLYEIDILYKAMAKNLGMTLKRVDSLNIHPLFIEALKDMALKGLKEKGWA